MKEATELARSIESAASAVRGRTGSAPQVGIILGTGLGGIGEAIEVETRIPYSEIPGFPAATVASHAGTLLVGMLRGKPVIAMEGRFHYYEGHSLAQVTMPVRVFAALGVDTLIVSNAAGGLNPHYHRGDIMLIDDHINLMGVNPLIGPNDDTLGPRFPDMSEPYSRAILDVAEEVALSRGIRAHRGVYAAMTGPCLETRAEYRLLRLIGADAIGMSTVPETIVAVHAGLKVFGLSCITDICLPDHLEPVDIAEILNVAREAEPKLTLLVADVVERLEPRGRKVPT